MKHSKLLALSAITLLGFSACQKPELESELTSGVTHTVTFVAGAPETKTTVDISDGETARFAWTEYDESRFTVYENRAAAKETNGILDDTKRKMTLKATFEGTTPENASYVAVVNNSNDLQIMFSEAYAEDADILVSKAVSSFDGENGVQLQFKREVAIAKMTLKGLDAGEVVNHVTVSSTADIAGSYGVDGWNSTKTSLNIYSAKALDDQETYSIVANEAGEAVVWFTCIPQDAATLTVNVEAADGDTYTKEFSRPITLTRGDVKGFGVAMVKDTKSSYVLFEGNTLVEGDYIIVSSTSAMEASDANNDDRLDYRSVEITNNTISTSLQQLVWHIAPATTEDYWTIFNRKVNAYASSTGAKNKAQLLSIATDDKALWSCTKTKDKSTYDFTNKQNTVNKVNSTLRCNGTYGFACYSTSTGSALQLYKKDARTPLAIPQNLSVSDMTLSWSPVAGAVGYRVVVGNVTENVTEASYTFMGVADYYNVSVVALADADSETIRDSDVATLTDAKFGTPTLATPKLSAGVLKETSVAFSWTKDARATNGYHWALYDGENLVQEATETSKTSTEVTGLTFGTTYTAKVYALAVDGEKPYVQSATATLDLATKAKTTISTIVTAGTGTTTYAIADLTVMAVSGKYFVVKDDTGIMTAYKSTNATANVGDIASLQGTYGTSNGLNLFTYTSYSKGEGSGVVDHGTPYTLNADNIADYTSNSSLKYVKATVSVGSNGSSLTIGSTPVYLRPSSGVSVSEYAGKTITLMGYAFGYDTNYNNVVILGTSVELDQTVPYLAVDHTSKTWESDETDAAVFTVTTNAEGVKDWSVSPTTLDWATIAVDKNAGTITVTPKDANTAETANEATLTVTHSAGTLSETITLTQKGASTGGVVGPTDYVENFSKYSNSGNSNTAVIAEFAGDACKWSGVGATTAYYANTNNSDGTTGVTLLKPASGSSTYIISEKLQKGVSKLEITAHSNNTSASLKVYVVTSTEEKLLGEVKTTAKKTNFTESFVVDVTGEYQIKVVNDNTVAYINFTGLKWTSAN